MSPKSVYKILGRIVALFFFFFLTIIKVKKITAIGRFSITIFAVKTKMSRDSIPKYHRTNISEEEEMLKSDKAFFLIVWFMRPMMKIKSECVPIKYILTLQEMTPEASFDCDWHLYVCRDFNNKLQRKLFFKTTKMNLVPWLKTSWV